MPAGRLDDCEHLRALHVLGEQPCRDQPVEQLLGTEEASTPLDFGYPPPDKSGPRDRTQTQTAAVDSRPERPPRRQVHRKALANGCAPVPKPPPMIKLKLTAVGNSAGVVFSKEVLARLRVDKGDTSFPGIRPMASLTDARRD